MAADEDKGATTEGALLTGQQMQLISRDREAWQQLLSLTQHCLQSYIADAAQQILAELVEGVHTRRGGGRLSTLAEAGVYLQDIIVEVIC